MLSQASVPALLGGTPVRSGTFTRWPIFDSQDRRVLLEVLESRVWGYDGPKEREFEQRFARACGAAHAICVSNGTVSLEIALRALGIGPGDEVIVPALTWIAPAWAVVRCGAHVVFADVGPDWCLSAASAAERLTTRTRALIVVHTYCQVAEMDQILELAGGRGLLVVEDCAHAHGSRWGDRSVGTLGDAGSFSFQLGKAMSAGEGGAVITDDDEIADRVYALKNCGRPRRPHASTAFGTNMRLTEFQAAVLLGQLRRLDEQVARRMDHVRYFHAGVVDACRGLVPLALDPRITRFGAFAVPLAYDATAFAGLSTERLVAALRAEGVPARPPHEVVYQNPLWLAGLRSGPWDADTRATRLGLNARCPTAEHIASGGGIILPHEVFLGPRADVEDVIAAIAKVYRNADRLAAGA